MIIRDEGMKTEGISLSNWPVGKSVGHFVTNELTVDGTTPG